MSAKFTPGPWLAHKYVGDEENWFVRGPNDAKICGQGAGRVKEANARLIAAAPDTYRCTELLESLCAWLLHAFGPDSPAGKEAGFRQREAVAALAKARGEQHA